MMKYFLKILIVFVLATAAVVGMYYYTTGQKLPFLNNDETAYLTTVSKQPATEKNAGKKFLAGIDGYSLYKSARTVILEHGGKEFEFENWSSIIDEETPEMYMINLDGDDEKELVIKGVAGQDSSTGEYIYEIYILKAKENPDDGYTVSLLSQSTWRTILDTYIVAEISQLSTCSKILQFAMVSNSGTNIAYNKTTGIAENAHTGYARALQDKKGRYMTLDSWGKGKGIYYVSDDNRLCVEIEVNVNYKESSEVQLAGNIYFEIMMSEDGTITVTPKSIRFLPNETYAVSDPTVTASAWSYTLNNSAPTGSGEITWVKYMPSVDSTTLTDTVNLSAQEGDVAKLSSLTVSSDKAVLTAKSDCTFSSDVAESPDFSVIINKGTDKEYDIAYTAKLNNSNSVLTITFDRSYARDEIETIEINFGER